MENNRGRNNRGALDSVAGLWYDAPMSDLSERPEPTNTAGWLRRWRESSGLSQAQVAETLGVLQGTISKWETGQCRISIDDLRILVRVYGVSVDEAGRATFAPLYKIEAA